MQQMQTDKNCNNTRTQLTQATATVQLVHRQQCKQKHHTYSYHSMQFDPCHHFFLCCYRCCWVQAPQLHTCAAA